ncbi:single-stranded DNA-binding protein [Sedimentibacter hydroxybenzoicus DSM 7310]|uniref:Single-stranded DNA-binding protein n=1 Tax=Sedimentibacter hydroxybenzoicus DSM 7310 TaxID=1123245 RepID=A0A974BKQ2_SEDHY|nr:single-stranded DNA-binding protein [Sedimentibacter hydroxybenzoicus]NYB74862.1 single-stranded DNA-binding protein [Sedimentibacter hydroxybenzoicus DSM 7310]
MNDKQMQSNYIRIVGKINSKLDFSHEVFGEKFYEFIMEVPRLSDARDLLPVIISERLINDIDMSIGKDIVIDGQFRSYNRYEDTSNKLLLRVFVRDIIIPEDDELEELIRHPNEVFLNGYLCKETKFRTTPFGREITDMLIAVNRSYNKSDYIPCIAWGRNARYCEKLEVGDHIKIWGRIQSRKYQKKNENESYETKTAYEVSVTKLEHIKTENNRKREDEEEFEE